MKYNPLEAAYVSLPKFIANNIALINVWNSNTRCFGYAFLSTILDLINGNHKCKPHYYTEADFQADVLDQIQYPFTLEMIPQLYEQLQIIFNLFSFFDTEIHLQYIMSLSKRIMPRKIDLLYYDVQYLNQKL